MQQCSSTYYHARVCVKVQSLKAPYVWTPYVQNYGVLLLHCLKSPPRSFKNQQVPVSLGNWADVTVLMTESSFCLHLCQRSPIRNTHRPDMYGFPGLDLKFIWKETAQFWPWIDLVYNNIFGIQLSFCVFCVTFGKCVEFQGKTITFMFNYLLLLLSIFFKKRSDLTQNGGVKRSKGPERLCSFKKASRASTAVRQTIFTAVRRTDRWP